MRHRLLHAAVCDDNSRRILAHSDAREFRLQHLQKFLGKLDASVTPGALFEHVADRENGVRDRAGYPRGRVSFLRLVLISRCVWVDRLGLHEVAEKPEISTYR